MLGLVVKLGLQAAVTMVADSYLRHSGVYRSVTEKTSALVCEYAGHVWPEKSCCEGTSDNGEKVQLQHCKRCPATRELRVLKVRK